MRKLVLTLAFISAGGAASAQVQISGVLESYFMTRYDVGGFGHRLSWGELNVRFSPHVKTTLSMTETPTADTLDEAYVGFDAGTGYWRGGRMRLAFGLSDWSENFYNGFNHMSMLRANALTSGLRLFRDDTGAEATYSIGDTRVQMGVVDTRSTIYQYVPKELRHASARVERSIAGAVVGLNVLKSLTTTNDVYGFDLRWAIPRLIVKGEVMEGVGGVTAKGYTLDVAYRLPEFARTQVVGRTERLDKPSQGDVSLHTLGLRQVVDKNLTVNLNYGWSRTSEPKFVPSGRLRGWSLQAMFQMKF